MRKKAFSFVVLFCIFAGILSSCKSEFEVIRQSGDPKVILEKAYLYYEEEEYQKAQTLFELILNSYRGRPEAEELYFNYANTHYLQEDYILASYYFRNFSNTFTFSKKREEADFLSAYSNYLMSPSFRLDQEFTLKAIDEFQIFANTYPTSERVKQCNDLIDELRDKLELKAFEKGKMYYDHRNYKSAIQSLGNVLIEFPDTDRAEEIHYLMIKSSFEYAANSIFSKQEDRYDQTIEFISEFNDKYPRSNYKRELRSLLTTSKDRIKRFQS